MVKLALMAALLTLASCTTTAGNFCDIASPTRLSDAAIDSLSDAEVAKLLADNRKGAALCGWKT